MKIIIIILALSMLVGCSSESKYDVGYDDGYASGYNTKCEIRSTMIVGDFENESYSSGYYDGYKAGEEACKSGE